MADMTRAKLMVERMSLYASDAVLVEDASFQLGTGEMIALLGPNGAGKTSLIRGALGILPAKSGKAHLDGRDTRRLSPVERARTLAYLPQTRPLAWPNTVRDVVGLGRFAHGAALGRLSATDRAAVERALDACALESLAERATDTLSGGELARVHCARAFAAEAPLLIADEPVAALDPRHQYQTMSLIRRFVDNGGGALAILHDVSLAARFADRLIWMKEGRILADGPPAETLSEDRLASVYGIKARIDTDDTGVSIRIEGPC